MGNSLFAKCLGLLGDQGLTRQPVACRFQVCNVKFSRSIPRDMCVKGIYADKANTSKLQILNASCKFEHLKM